MIALWAALLLGAGAPCDHLAELDDELQAAAKVSPAQWKSARTRLEWELGRFPDPDDDARESQGPLKNKAVALSRKVHTLCGWKASSLEPSSNQTADHARLNEILARPEFAESRRDPSDFWVGVIGWLRDLLARLFEAEGMQGFAEGTRFVVLGVAVTIVLIGAVLLVRRQRRRRVVKNAAPAPTANLQLDSPPEHLQRARALVQGVPREAIREGLFALLSALERARLARPDRVKTNRELAAELPGRGAPTELTQAVRELMDWYDGAFYSLEPVPIAAALRFVEGVDGLSHELGRSP